MYFFLNRYQKLKGERAEYCKGIFGKLNEDNQKRLTKKGNVTAIVMGTIYAVVLALMVASAVVSFICKYWWAGVFFCVFSLLIAYLTYSGFSWKKREGYEYAKLFGEEIIYMLGRQERDKLNANVTVDEVLEKVVEEHKTTETQPKKKSKKAETKKAEKVEPVETVAPVEKTAKRGRPATSKTTVEEKKTETAPAEKTTKRGRPAKAETTTEKPVAKRGRPAKAEETEKKTTAKKATAKTVAKRGRPKKNK